MRLQSMVIFGFNDFPNVLVNYVRFKKVLQRSQVYILFWWVDRNELVKLFFQQFVFGFEFWNDTKDFFYHFTNGNLTVNLGSFPYFFKIEILMGFVKNLLLNVACHLFPISEFNILFNDVVHDDTVFKLFEKFSINPHSFRTNWFFNQTQ